MTYAAYLRIYEPVSAFGEPDRSRWAAYAASAARPRRRDSLMVEHAEALRRAIAAPQVVVPERESEHAYVRHADGITYVCPWQTRLRCLLAYDRMLSATGAPLRARCRPETVTIKPWRPWPGSRTPDRTAPRPGCTSWPASGPCRWPGSFRSPRAERWLSLGPGRGRAAAQAAAPATRALVYTTPMSRARRRVARGLAALRGLPAASGDAAWEPPRAEGDLAEVGRWLEEFHPYSLVELDYGGLVHLVSDDALCSDQSVAEIRAAIDGAARGEWEPAAAMYMRAHSRWRAFAEFELAN